MDLKLGSTAALIAECKAQGLSRNQCAYVLATAYHETAHTMKPIYERGQKSYFNKYEPGTKLGKALGNTEKGDGYRYRGAGYVQLTGRANFIRAGKKIGRDLVNSPELAIDPAIAAKVAVRGMVEGWFTGKKLSDYISGARTDFNNARRIINGTDKAATIANYARNYMADLENAGYASGKPASAKKPAPASLVDIKPKPAPAPSPVAPDSSIVEQAQRRLAELKYNPGGIDGKIGPLTRGAILVFRHDNNLPASDSIDADFLTALAVAQPRDMVPARANAKAAEIAAKVPEAGKHSWNKIVALGSGAATVAGGAVDQLAPATGYLQPVKDFLGEVPTFIWFAAIVVVAGVIWWNARSGQKAADLAYRNGDRR